MASFKPVDKTKIAVGLADDAVAGVKPAVAEGLGGLVGHGEIAGGEGERFVGAQDKFARLAVGSVVAVVVDDARVETVAHLAHAAGTLLRERAADDEIGLGRAVAVDQPDAGALLERGVEIAPARRAPARMRTQWHAPRARRLARQQDRHHGAEHDR